MNYRKQVYLLVIFLSNVSAEDHADICRNYIATPGWVYCLQSFGMPVLQETKVPTKISNSEFEPPYPIEEGDLVPMDIPESHAGEDQNETDVMLSGK